MRAALPLVGAFVLALWGAPALAQQAQPSARMRGDFVIGALFSVHRQPQGGHGHLVCGKVNELYGIQRIETALWTLDKINNSSKVLRGVTLGLEARDSCWYAPVALQQSIELVRDAITPAIAKPILQPDGLQDSCLADAALNREKRAPLIGVVGPGASSVALQVQNLLQLFSIPQVGYSCTSRDLNDKSRYSTFLRVVPSDLYQAQLLVDLVRHFNWTYVSTVSTDENYGTSGIQTFRELAEKNGVCVAREKSILTTADKSDFDAVLANLNQDRQANVVVCFCEGFTVRHLLEASRRMNLTERFVFVGSDGWADRDDVVEELEREASGSLSIRIYSPHTEDFASHYLSLHPHNNTRNPWFNEFWQSNFNCTLPSEAGKEVSDKLRNLPNCTGEERLTYEEYKQDPKMGFVMKSFWVMAHGLHNMLEEICGQNYTGVCKEIFPFNGTRFKNHLMNVTFNFGEEVVKFDRRGDPPARYEILNYQKMQNGTYGYVQIGEWNNGTLTFARFSKYRGLSLVESVCSKPCPPGHYKNFKSGGQEKRCCWSCVSCDQYQYTNEEQSNCTSCPYGTLPNGNKTGCYVIPVEYTQWSDAEAIIAMTLAAVGLLATFLTCHIFIGHNDTPVVKASTRELSYLILAGMTLCHISVLTILTKPTEISCTLSRLMPGISFAMIYASLFTKTNRIARILAGSKRRFPKQKPLFMSATAQILITCSLIAIEACIATTTLMMEPAGPILEFPARHRAVLTCATRPRAVLSPLAFDALLVGLCTLYAIKTRNVPENFNEAKFIGFAMYTTCVIWIAFGPIYFGSETKVLTMCMCVTLSASVTLVFLFMPKLYIIVLRPERNNRAFFTTSKSLRYHFGARMAGAIAEPAPKRAAYRISESVETESSSAYRSVGRIKKRTLSIQTDKELIASFCRVLSLQGKTTAATSSARSLGEPCQQPGQQEEEEEEEEEEDEDEGDQPACELCEGELLRGGALPPGETAAAGGPTGQMGTCAAPRASPTWAELDIRRLFDDLRRRSATTAAISPSAARQKSNGLRAAAADDEERPWRYPTDRQPRARIREERSEFGTAGTGGSDPVINITITLGNGSPD